MIFRLRSERNETQIKTPVHQNSREMETKEKENNRIGAEGEKKDFDRERNQTSGALAIDRKGNAVRRGKKEK